MPESSKKIIMSDLDLNHLYCPLPMIQKERIILSHGSGGRTTKDLIDSVFIKYFNNPALLQGNDFCEILLSGKGQKLIVSTDAHVVNPIFFPGGDIGRLAVSGTVNDVSMSGGKPKYLTATFIIEEGFLIRDLEKISESMQKTAEEADVSIVAGDTKVVEKGKTDKIFISTTGIGFAPKDLQIGGQYAQDGDIVIISGSIGDHGIAILAARNELGFRTQLESDVAPLNHIIESVFSATHEIHVLRDPTRGGLATSLNEIAQQSKVTIELVESAIPIKKEVRRACEMLGFDPLYIANEGKVIIIAPKKFESKILNTLKNFPLAQDAAIIGTVKTSQQGSPRVIMHTNFGGTRIVDMLSGELLPRIC